MGCFDSNCCVTGLPLHHYDKVRAALLIPYQPEKHSCYIGSAYQFWTMPVSSEYNDYGNIEWSEIADEHRWGLEFILKLMLPGMRDRESYSRDILKDGKELSLEELWQHITHNDLEFDPDREQRNKIKEWRDNGSVEEDRPPGIWMLDDKIKFRMWMCHEWAYQEVLNLHHPNPRFAEQADNYCYTHVDFDAEMEGVNRGTDATEEEKKKFHECFAKWKHSEKHWIEGEQGGIAQDVRRLIQTGPGRGTREADQTEFMENREAFKERLIETAHFCSNMFLIRKILMPMTTFGTQYDDWDVIPKWTALVAQKVADKVQERKDEGF